MSILEHEPNIRTVVYDLGLTKHQRNMVARLVPESNVKTFDYSAHPDYFTIAVNAGEYAWKPTLIADEILSCDAPMIWMDAGNLLAGSLDTVRQNLGSTGF